MIAIRTLCPGHSCMIVVRDGICIPTNRSHVPFLRAKNSYARVGVYAYAYIPFLIVFNTLKEKIGTWERNVRKTLCRSALWAFLTSFRTFLWEWWERFESVALSFLSHTNHSLAVWLGNNIEEKEAGASQTICAVFRADGLKIPYARIWAFAYAFLPIYTTTITL